MTRMREMRFFYKIIVGKRNDHWFAWFQSTPQIAVGGQSIADAILGLTDSMGTDQFDVDQIVPFDKGARKEYREFLVPLRTGPD